MQAFEQSGQTQRSFREVHGMGRSTFQYWLRRYRQSRQEPYSAQSDFISLAVKPVAEPLSEAAVVITFPNGARVELHTPTEVSFIRQLIGY